MFSGITQGLFKVSQVERSTGRVDYTVIFNDPLLKDLICGASVSVDGVCQTVTAIQGHEVSFTAMEETLRLTTLNHLFPGRMVSLERSVRLGDEIGGHIVAGHIIGMAYVEQIDRRENNLSLTLRCPAPWMKYILPKGFIAVDGSSLTIGAVDLQGLLTIHLIPETLRLTNFGNKQLNDPVNIEIDHQVQTIVETVERYLTLTA